MNDNKIIIPPIKSQGIKTKLVPWIQSILPQKTGRWFEPFMGTGVVAFNAGFKETYLCDINPHIINFYNSIKNNDITPHLVRLFLEKEGNILKNKGEEHYKFIRDRFNKYFDPLDFLFLSRAGFNGMIRFNKKGGWNIPFCKKINRFNKSYITKIVNQVYKVSECITSGWIFECADFKEVIKKAGENDIIYCDPPYFGRYVDYYNGWTAADEEGLFKSLNKTKAKFILSIWHHNNYRSNLMIEKYWNIFNIITKEHYYHSGGRIENRNSIVEALVYNFELNFSKPVENSLFLSVGNMSKISLYLK